MSWGERSCKHFHQSEGYCKPELHTCNVNCPLYENDGITKPVNGPEVQRAKERGKIYLRSLPKSERQGRNEPCRCGSNVKAKNCCLKNQALLEQVKTIQARHFQATRQ